ncbi:hypothetical protein [Cryobacterium sp. PAMC25264]|uniref:hypothetical protein n=1 Tax=Cryobacterium sp. PAMC25264 TaxID=2861288 RepID=UPI001C625BD4|nr:hypothetical protein [Cryobacterium sp. PAMC25264]QYF72691.1 hypothetical protein KY500_12875 [Cryobacterium sp. PAMC25264]
MSGPQKSAAERRRQLVASRSSTASPGQGESQPTRFRAGTLYLVGGILVVIALVVLAVLIGVTAQGRNLSDFVGGASWGTNLVAAPIMILMLAAAPLFLAEFHRRGRWSTRERGFIQGGSNVVELRPAPLWSRALFILLSVAAWVGLIAVPVYLDVTTDTFADADDSLWVLLVLYGFFASGMAAVLLFSLLKRLTYEPLANRFGDQIVPGSVSQVFWRAMSYRFRFELWFAFGFGAILGTIPLVYQSAADDCYTQSCAVVPDPAWLAWILWIAAGCAALAVIGCLNAWRSGKSLYSGESVS